MSHKAVAATAKGHYDEIQVTTEIPGEGEVLIKVAYAAMIAVDTYVTDRGFLVENYPVIYGFGASGTIEKIGSGVDGLNIGDRVTAFTYARNKAMQEYTIQPWTTVAKIPDSLSLEEAATLPDNFVTAFFTLFNQLGLPTPSVLPAPVSPPLSLTPILIYGAGSTAGAYSIQLLALAGYKNIIATASARNHEQLRSLGAKHVFDYKSPSLVEDIASAVGNDGKVLITVDCITTETTLDILGKIVSPLGKVALLLPIKEGNAVSGAPGQEMYFEVRQDKNPFPKSTEIIYVKTFTYHQDEFLRNNLMPKILPALLETGHVKPSRVRLIKEGSFKERVGIGLDLLRNNKVSGEKVVVEIPGQ